MSEPLTWMGYWGDGDEDDPDIPEPWVPFMLIAHSNEVGDSREATEEDLRLLGFIRAQKVDP